MMPPPRHQRSSCSWIRPLLLFALLSDVVKNRCCHHHVDALLDSQPKAIQRIRGPLLSTTRLFEGQWDHEVNPDPFFPNYNQQSAPVPPQQQQLQGQSPPISSTWAQQASSSLSPLKVMIFIDGTWLYYSLYERDMQRDIMSNKLGNFWPSKYEIDWSRLPTVACQALLQDKKSSWSAIMPVNNNQNGFAQQQQRPIEVSRVNVYSSMHRDTPPDSFRFQMFQNMVNAGFDVNMKETPAGRKGEKCVDIQLAVDMLYYATVPDAYDVALLLTGDRDFLPAVIRCRQKGRRIGLVSMRSAAALAFEETPNLKDYDTIWLEDYIDQWTRKIPRHEKREINGSLKGTFNRRPVTSSISEYVIKKVLRDFIAKSGEERVSSRDIGRHLKDLLVGGRPLLREVKEVYGGLYQFLILSEIFVVELEQRVHVRNFWVSNIPDTEISQPNDLADEEKEFLEIYDNSPQPIKEIAYEFTLADYDPNFTGQPVTPEQLAERFLKVDYSQFTVAELKEICRKNNLQVSGLKSALIKRIEEHMAKRKASSRNKDLDNVDPDRRLEMIVLEYLHANGGEASSRDVGRYLSANKASSRQLALEQGRSVTALKEMKDRYGSLLRFVERSELCNYGGEIRPNSGEFTVIAAPDAERRLEERTSTAVED